MDYFHYSASKLITDNKELTVHFALFYFQIGIKCVPHWLYTYAWKDELICAGQAHTMCALIRGVLDVTPPGRVTSQQALLQACPRDIRQFLLRLKQSEVTLDNQYNKLHDV